MKRSTGKLIVLAVLLSVLLLSATSVLAATLSYSISDQGNCTWNITLTGSGYSPGASMYVDLTSNETACDGRQTNNGFGDWHVGSADGSGNFSMTVIHQGWGDYVYTLRDSNGVRSYVMVSYRRDNNPRPTGSLSTFSSPESPNGDNPSANNQPAPVSGGGLDIAGYCASRGQGAPSNQGRDWFCGGSSWQLSMQEVCSWQYPGSTAVNPDPMNGYGWSCSGGNTSNPNTGSSSDSTAGETTSSSNSSNIACAPTRLGIGDIAIVNPENDHINLRSRAGLDSSVLTSVPARSLLTLIGNAVCVDGWQWYETQYAGYTGWVAEINSAGVRNLLRNGESLPQPQVNGPTVVSPTAVPAAPPVNTVNTPNCNSYFSVGQRIELSQGVHLLDNARTNANTVYTARVGESIVMEAGPSCVDVWCGGMLLPVPECRGGLNRG